MRRAKEQQSKFGGDVSSNEAQAPICSYAVIVLDLVQCFLWKFARRGDANANDLIAAYRQLSKR